MKKRKIKNKKYELLTWLLLIISNLVLFFNIKNCRLIPDKTKFLILLFALITICIRGIISILSNKYIKYISGTINLCIVVIVLATSFILPKIDDGIHEIFVNDQDYNSTINVYKLKNSNENLNPDANIIVLETTYDEIQEDSLQSLFDFFGGNITFIKTKHLSDSLEKAYSGEGGYFLVKESYLQIQKEYNEFENFINHYCDLVYTFTNKKTIKTTELIKELENEPFAVFVSSSGSLEEIPNPEGNNELNYLFVVNPKTNQIISVNIPKGTFLQNFNKGCSFDLLSNIGLDGVDNTVDSLSRDLDLDIKLYGLFNYRIIKKIIDIIGGIDVINPYSFESTYVSESDNNEYYRFFDKGEIHLNGEDAYTYIKEKTNLKNSEADRKEHQKIVLKATIKKILDIKEINKFKELLNCLKGQFFTNLDVEELSCLMFNELVDINKWEIISYNLSGNDMLIGSSTLGWDVINNSIITHNSQRSLIVDQIRTLYAGERINKSEITINEDLNPVYTLSNLEEYINRKSSQLGQQDIAIYNNKIFGFAPNVAYYDNTKHSMTCGHGNNCMFGNELHGEYPYLYCGSWDKNDCNVYINEITKEEGNLVRTISYPTLSGYLNCCVDEYNERIYILLCTSETTPEGKIDFIVSDFDGKILSRNSIEDIPIVQGMVFYNDYIYVLSGSGATGKNPNTLTILDKEGRTIVKNSHTNIEGEFEGIDFCDGNLFIATLDTIFKSDKVQPID